MKIAIDFDGTIVEQNKPYDQVDGEFTFVPGAEAALWALKRAGHQLLLWSARASLALRQDWRKDRLWATSLSPSTARRIESSYAINEQRYREMVTFAHNKLGGLFDAVDDGTMGKPHVDLFIDDKCLRLGGSGVTWAEIEETHGEPKPDSELNDASTH